jgi:hypothetical protein
MPRSIIEFTIHVTARLKDCGDSSVHVRDDILNPVLKFIWFTSETMSVIVGDIHAFQSLLPRKVRPHNDRLASQWNGKGKFFEDANSIVASVPQQRITKQRYSQGS